jgi:hypothetical protein
MRIFIYELLILNANSPCIIIAVLQILSSVQVNQYVDEYGSRPFAAAPDELVTEVAIIKF